MRHTSCACGIGLSCMGILAVLCSSAAASQHLVPSSYSTIQAAVNACYNTGDEVVLAPGTYTGSGNRDIDFGGRKITVRSTDPSNPSVVQQTVIDCGGNPAEPHRAFAFHTGETGASIVAGLTIVNGYSPAAAWTGQTRDSGGAIYIDSASPAIQDCTITSCQAGSYGGAIYCRGGGPSISRCTFGNCGGAGVTGGAIFGDTANANVSSCSFTSNNGQIGGAAAFAAGSPSLAICIFDGNRAGDRGGAIHSDSASLQVDRCVFRGNTATLAGGAVYRRTGNTVSLSNSLLVGNRASQGGAVCADGGSLSLANCTLGGNSAETGGGGLSVFNAGTATLGNTILWGDSAPAGAAVALQGGSALSLSYSDVQGDWIGVSCPADCTQAWGDGCLSRDPLFVDPDGPDNDPATFADNDYRLQPDSPCIHGGNPNLNYAGKKDLAGQLRVLGPRVDIGAYEATSYYLAYNINQGRWHATIQEAIDAANANDQVVLNAGTHSGSGNRDLDFHGKAMTLRSSDPTDPAVVAATIIHSNGSGSEPHRGLVFRSGEGAGTIVSGLTIYGGYAPVETIGGATSAAGGAILCDGAGPMVSYCTIHANTSTDRGGGLFCNNAGLTLSHCQIASNTAGTCTGAGGTVGAGGGIHAIGSTLVLEDCQITGNHIAQGPSYQKPLTGTGIDGGDGGGVWCKSSTITFRNCTFSGNNAGPGGYAYSNNNANGGKGGAACAASGSLSFVDCTLTANNAGPGSGGYSYASKGSGGAGGALYCSGALLSMTGCTITGNSAGGGGSDTSDERKGRAGDGGPGGAIYCGAASFSDCLIQGNKAGNGGWGEFGGGGGGSGGGIYSSTGTVTLTHCTVRDNAAGDADWGQEPVRSGGGGGGIVAISVIAHRCIIAGNKTGHGGPADTAYSDFGSGSGGSGGGISCTSITIDNSLLVNNATGYGPRAGTGKRSSGGNGGSGGGIYCSSGTVIHCTFVGNTTGPGGDGYYDNNSLPGKDGTGPSIQGNPTVRNCIFWVNVMDTRLGLAPDPRNMAVDPKLVDLDGADNNPATWQDNDYHLAPGSPCINAGDNAAGPLFSDVTTSNGTTDTLVVADASKYTPGDQVEYAGQGQVRTITQIGLADHTVRFDAPLPTASQVGKTIRNYGPGDLDGHARLLQGRVDLGAYESQPAFSGDCNGDGCVDLVDLLVIVGAWGTGSDQVGYNAAADLNGDGAVDVCDLLTFVADWGKSVQ